MLALVGPGSSSSSRMTRGPGPVVAYVTPRSYWRLITRRRVWPAAFGMWRKISASSSEPASGRAFSLSIRRTGGPRWPTRPRHPDGSSAPSTSGRGAGRSRVGRWAATPPDRGLLRDVPGVVPAVAGQVPPSEERIPLIRGYRPALDRAASLVEGHGVGRGHPLHLGECSEDLADAGECPRQVPVVAVQPRH